MRRLKIAIVTPTFPPYRGGIGTVAQQDAEQLSAIGHDVTVFAPSPRKPAERAPAAYRVTEVRPLFRYGNAALLPLIGRRLRGYDVTVLHYPFFGGAEPAAFFGPRKGGKLIVTYHMDVVGTGPLAAVFAVHGAIMRPLIMRRADRIAVTSFDYIRSSAIGATFRKDPSLFRELPPSVDIERFRPGDPDPEIAKRYGIDAVRPCAIFVGGLDRAHYFKGVPVLLDAFAAAPLKDAGLIVVGDGDLRASFEDRARELGIRNRVAFTGGVPDEHLPDLHRLAKVFAFPSVDRSEAFGIAALEASASGLPVVASDLAGVRTIVRDGETGHRVRPGSVSALAARIADLLGDDRTRERLGAAGRRMAVEEYSGPARRERWRRVIDGIV